MKWLSKLSCFLLFIFSFHTIAKDYEFDNFLITDYSVCPIKKGMSINDIMELIPSNQIKMVTNYGEFLEDEFDDYEIYDLSGEHILTVTPKVNNNLDSNVERVLIASSKLKTISNIGLGSSYGEVQAHYPDINVSPDIEAIAVTLDSKESLIIGINKQHLFSHWWDEKSKRVNLDGIPKDAKISSFVVWWDENIGNRLIEKID
ncbi:hypothetical protein PVK64_17795 [Aliivibrio sp. S4TY2]|uniref:hypothetical protein n=1 Tax=unclassified Aliivibrio TaxID=2645654 RepID=UPI002378099F|nr:MULTISPECIES: hypothetical protein [unclassified Aliivibrio]MDD9158019.1 hypothetical protein [Aliivibrio sp. S4TY2]MDD9161938.1 hypothetical protein [Aliivibrio sp. S4TY1]MDD9166016.1 hypothetical protein [Aliivibrio sp. S4MY2]MDD9170018.1 hypothetical protein [Aliivibrio sp. S4MY4]MDD9187069.1 hypothetical protein [Aliivibrio sp. S4MY3]